MFLRVHSPAVPVPPQWSWTQRCALSAHSPCCRDEASSISSPATLCEEEPHRLILQPGGTCTRPLLSCSPESHARGWDLFPRGTKGPHLSHHGQGLQATAAGAESPARPSFHPSPKHCGAPPASWGKVCSDMAAAKRPPLLPKACQGHREQRHPSPCSPTGTQRQPRLLAPGYWD